MKKIEIQGLCKRVIEIDPLSIRSGIIFDVYRVGGAVCTNLSLPEAESLLQTLQEAITAVRSAGELADSGEGTS